MATGHRTVVLTDGGLIHIKRNDPYGFWRINYDKGQLPERLKQDYTAASIAIDDLKKHLDEKKRTIKEIIHNDG